MEHRKVKLCGMLVRGQGLYTYMGLLVSTCVKMEGACQGDRSVCEV